MKKLLLATTIILAFGLFAGCSSSSYSLPKELVVYFVPSRDAEEIVTATEPLKELLKNALKEEGYEFEDIKIEVGTSFEAAGATKLQAFCSAIMPQILPTYLSTYLYSFEINVRYATILGYVGAGGIGLILNEKIGWREYDKVGMILVMLFITVVLIEYTSKYIREKLS